MKKKEVKKAKTKKKEEPLEAPIPEEKPIEEKPIEPISIPPELLEKVNELEIFIATAEKWGIHRIGQAYHLLDDAKKAKEQYK